MMKGSPQHFRRSNSCRNALFAIIFFLLVAIGYVRPAAAGSRNPAVDLHLLHPGTTVVVDLDGDQIPDLASGTNLGRMPQGYAYRVDLDLTDNSQPKPFRVFSTEPNGVAIKAVDVDGDQDLDLVITGRLLHEPIGVWINDGRGNFIPGDSTQYGDAYNETDSSLASSLQLLNSVLWHEFRQIDVALDRHGIPFKPRHSATGFLDLVFARESRVCTESVRDRAPPLR
jgi:hypothetical protein